MDIKGDRRAMKLLGDLKLDGTFESFKALDHGTYAYIVQGRTADGRDVALKVPRSERGHRRSCIDEDTFRELRGLTTVRHPNVIALTQVYAVKGTSLIFQTKLYDCSLAWYMRRAPRMTLGTIKWVFREICKGLAAAHALGVMHRDLKPGNILLMTGDTPEVVVADWGLSRDVRDTSPSMLTGQVFTTWYAPPEVLCETRVYGPSADVWSLGIILLDMYCGRPVFKMWNRSTFMMEVINLVGSGDHSYLESIMGRKVAKDVPGRLPVFVEAMRAAVPELADLVTGLLQVRPSDRILAADLENHAFFAECAPRPLATLRNAGEDILVETGTGGETAVRPLTRRSVPADIRSFTAGWPHTVPSRDRVALLRLVEGQYVAWFRPLLLAMHIAHLTAEPCPQTMFACFTLAAGAISSKECLYYRSCGTSPYYRDSHLCNLTQLSKAELNILEGLEGAIPQLPHEYECLCSLAPKHHSTAAFILSSNELMELQAWTVEDVAVVAALDVMPSIVVEWMSLCKDMDGPTSNLWS